MKRDSFHVGMIVTAVILGLWVFVCPWVIAGSSATPANWNFHIAGLLAVLFASVALVRSDDLPEYGLAAVGLLLMVSPWVLGLDSLVTRQAVFYGFLLAGLGWFGRPSYKPKAQTSD